MSTDTDIETEDYRKWSAGAIAAAALLLLMFGIIAIGSIRGCFFADSEQAADATEKQKKNDAEKKKKEEKPPIKIEPPIVLPSEPKVPLPPAKPGHWAMASQEITANLQDFVGDSR